MCGCVRLHERFWDCQWEFWDAAVWLHVTTIHDWLCTPRDTDPEIFIFILKPLGSQLYVPNSRCWNWGFAKRSDCCKQFHSLMHICMYTYKYIYVYTSIGSVHFYWPRRVQSLRGQTGYGDWVHVHRPAVSSIISLKVTHWDGEYLLEDDTQLEETRRLTRVTISDRNECVPPCHAARFWRMHFNSNN